MMPKFLLIEEYHLSVYARAGLSEEAYEALRRTLDAQAFHKRLRRAVLRVLRRHPALRDVHLRLSR